MARLPILPIADDSVARRLTGVMVLGFLALIGIGVAAGYLVQRNQLHSRWVAHTYEVENAILYAGRLIEEAESTRRGYLLSPGTQAYLDGYRRASARLPVALEHIRQLTVDNPMQQDLWARLREHVAALTARRTQTIALLAAGDHRGALSAFRADTEAASMRTIRAVFGRMAREERRLLSIRARELRDSQRVFYLVLAVAGALVIAVAVTALLTILSYTRKLGNSRDALQSLNASLEDMVEERTADLTRANEEIQRFAYIVSHDLRSPLVNVMGFTAELEAATQQLGALVDTVEQEAPHLVTDDARFAAREDLPEAIGFIRTSTSKMDRLINAILQLSRQGRRTLAPEPVDMHALVTQIGGTLSHRLSEAGATLDVAGSLPVVVTDRFSIDQVFSNLIENAVKYLRPGVPGRITVSGRRDAGRLIYTVADNGRGIDPRDHARVFDLFRRSGVQDQPGEGIGLATVRALVFRLGGMIDLQSTVGQGATFTLSLPLSLDLQEKAE